MYDGSESLSDDPLARLQQQTEKLTKQLRQAHGQINFLQIFTLLLTAAIFGGGYYLTSTGRLLIQGISPPVAANLETRQFGLYNREGGRVIYGTQDKFGYPELIFLSTGMQAMMRIRIWNDRGGIPGMVFSDSRGLRGIFRIDPEGASVLNLVGKEQKGSIMLAVSEKGDPKIEVKDKAGKVVWQTPDAAK
jgi:hypothetical protein